MTSGTDGRVLDASATSRWYRSAGATARRAPAPALLRLAGPLVTGAVVLAGTVLVAAVDPEQPGHYPTCPTLALTGFYCPGCGGLRAVHALAHGDLALALHRNALVVLAAPLVLAAWVAWVRRRVLDRPVRWVPSASAWWVVGALVVFWAVLRNVPATAFLAP